MTPPENPPEVSAKICNYETLFRIKVRQHVKVFDETLRKGVKDVLDQMSQAPEKFTEEMVSSDEEFLNSKEGNILNYKEFSAGSFGNSYPAWEELRRESKRQTSKSLEVDQGGGETNLRGRQEYRTRQAKPSPRAAQTIV
jgi:hypothetical protein